MSAARSAQGCSGAAEAEGGASEELEEAVVPDWLVRVKSVPVALQGFMEMREWVRWMRILYFTLHRGVGEGVRR